MSSMALNTSGEVPAVTDHGGRCQELICVSRMLKIASCAKRLRLFAHSGYKLRSKNFCEKRFSSSGHLTQESDLRTQQR